MRDYLIDNDRAKLTALVNTGKHTLEQVKELMAKGGEGVSPRAVEAWLAGTPEVAKKLGGKFASEPKQPKDK